MVDIYLLVGVPASGKSWVLERVAGNYTCVHHDDYLEWYGSYLQAIMNAADTSTKPVLCEAPFSMSRIINPLMDMNYVVKPVFVIEGEDLLRQRWSERGTIDCAQKGHLSRQQTFKARVGEYNAFCGDSSDVLNHLNLLAAEREVG